MPKMICPNVALLERNYCYAIILFHWSFSLNIFITQHKVRKFVNFLMFTFFTLYELIEMKSCQRWISFVYNRKYYNYMILDDLLMLMVLVFSQVVYNYIVLIFAKILNTSFGLLHIIPPFIKILTDAKSYTEKPVFNAVSVLRGNIGISLNRALYWYLLICIQMKRQCTNRKRCTI